MSIAVVVLLYVLGVSLIVVGLAGLVLPGIPGAPVIFAGIFAVAWADDFSRIGVTGLVVTGSIAVVISVVDFLAGVVGAKQFGASYWGLLGAFTGLLVGLPFGLLGIVIGPIAGSILLEYLKEPDFKRAGKVGLGTLAGFVIGTAVKYSVACALLGTALLFYVL